MLPGNLLLEIVGQFPSLAGPFRIRASEETGYASLNGWFSLLFSLVPWLYALVKLCDLRDWMRQRFGSRSAHGHGNNTHHHHHAGMPLTMATVCTWAGPTRHDVRRFLPWILREIPAPFCDGAADSDYV